ncbi:ATP-binding protein [Xanthomonas campestris pv. cannae]|nr:ATP-binding protein [Xanthomonas campestris pv. cannae]
MTTIRLQTNQHRLIANLRHAFNQRSMLGELLQNARRAQASEIRVYATDDCIAIHDNGSGIEDLQSLIHIAESGWKASIRERENAFGMGALATLYFAERLMVRSRDKTFSARSADILAGNPIEVLPADGTWQGTQIQLDGVRSPDRHVFLPDWVRSEMRRLCEAFPVRVYVNDVEVPRPLAKPDLRWRETSMGKVLIDLHGATNQWRCFLQGLPIQVGSSCTPKQIVLLPDDMVAKLPDRQHLLNETSDIPRIQAAVNQAYRQALMDAKAELADHEFAEWYADACVISSNADLLSDVPFVPRAWFRNWEERPAGVARYWEEFGGDGVIAAEALREAGAWRIDDDGNDALLPEVYLQAASAYALEQFNLDPGHWLLRLVRPLSAEQIAVSVGASLHRVEHPGLADCEVALELVNSLRIGLLEGGKLFDVSALRKDGTLYVTREAGSVTRLVSDYTVDDRYDEDLEEDDEEAIRTFIAVGSSSSPHHVVEALLPDALRFKAQAKLAGASVRLAFDAEGKLASVTSS